MLTHYNQWRYAMTFTDLKQLALDTHNVNWYVSSIQYARAVLDTLDFLVEYYTVPGTDTDLDFFDTFMEDVGYGADWNGHVHGEFVELPKGMVCL